MKAVLVVSMLVLGGIAWAADPASSTSGEKTTTVVEAKEAVKEGGRSIGHFFRDTARAIGHGTRDAARAVGDGVRDAAKGTGAAATEAWHKVTGDAKQ